MRFTVGLVCLVASGSVARAQGLDEAQLVVDVSAAGEAAGTPVGSVSSGTLRRGRSRSFDARLEANECYLFVARGGEGIENLDLTVRRGRTALTRDTQTGRGADARHCTGDRAERVRFTVSAFRGAGPFAAGLFEARPAEEAAPALGTEGTLLERLRAAASAHGASMAVVTTPRRESLAEGARIERDVTLAPGRCYRVLVVSDGSITDVDVALLGPDGGAMQSDTGDAPDAHLGVLRPLCPARPGAHRVALRAHAGSGDIAWQVLGSVAGGRDTRERTEQASRFRVGGTGSGFVNSRVRERHRAAGRGRAAVTDLVTGTLRTGGARTLPIEVEGGKCYLAIAAGVPSVRELDLRVVDPYGNERAHDSTRDAFPVTGSFCPNVSGRWTVEVRMFNGYGPYGVQVFGGSR